MNILNKETHAYLELLGGKFCSVKGILYLTMCSRVYVLFFVPILMNRIAMVEEKIGVPQYFIHSSKLLRGTFFLDQFIFFLAKL